MKHWLRSHHQTTPHVVATSQSVQGETRILVHLLVVSNI